VCRRKMRALAHCSVDPLGQRRVLHRILAIVQSGPWKAHYGLPILPSVCAVGERTLLMMRHAQAAQHRIFDVTTVRLSQFVRAR